MRLAVILLILLKVAACQAQSIELIDDTARSGIDFVHQDGSSGQQFLVELMGAGVATFDINNDGWLDILLLNGSELPGAKLERAPLEGVYLNRHDGTFANVVATSGAGDPQYSLGVAVGDYNNDGYEDVYLSNFGPKSLLRNNGDGTFSNVSLECGVSDGEQFGAGVAFLDMEGDGDLDLYAGNYVEFDFQRHASLIGKTFPYPPGPQHYPYARDTLFRNEGDGHFTDVTQEAGMSVRGPTMGLVCGDFDLDGDTDIFVGNDAAPNLLFQNEGGGRFIETALVAGVAYDASGKPVGSMGSEAGDIDNDGLDDLCVTDYSGQLPLVFRNLGGMAFEDFSRSSRVGVETLPHAKWAAGLADFDNDADRDLFICQGHLLKNAKQIEQLTDFRVRNSLLQNNGRGRFTPVTDRSGNGLAIVESTRGASFDDLDNDGDIDAVLLNCAARANLLRNQSSGGNHWISVELVGRRTNRSAVGSRVRVISAGSTQSAEVHAGRSYQSHYGTRLHFGLGTVDRIEQIEIDWLGGEHQVISSPPVDQRLKVVQP